MNIMIILIAFLNLILAIFYTPLMMSAMAVDSPSASNVAYLLAYTGLSSVLFPFIASIMLVITHNYVYLFIDFIPILVICIIMFYYYITGKKEL